MKPTRTRRQGIDGVDSTGPTRAQTVFRGAKKAAVAVGGGAMTGVGLMLVPTPLPGELLVLGGVYLLGTEFEAPGRLMKNARNKFARVVQKQIDDGDGDGEVHIVSAEDARTVKHSNTFIKRTMAARESSVSEVSAESTYEDCNEDKIYEYDYDFDHDDLDSTEVAVQGVDSSSTSQSMTDRCKRFGRNYVLPVLDHAAGDKNTTDGCDKEKVATPRLKLSLKEQIEAELRRHAPSTPTVEQRATSASRVIEAVEEPVVDFEHH
jgi:hypothetical protein